MMIVTIIICQSLSSFARLQLNVLRVTSHPTDLDEGMEDWNKLNSPNVTNNSHGSHPHLHLQNLNCLGMVLFPLLENHQPDSVYIIVYVSCLSLYLNISRRMNPHGSCSSIRIRVRAHLPVSRNTCPTWEIQHGKSPFGYHDLAWFSHWTLIFRMRDPEDKIPPPWSSH